VANKFPQARELLARVLPWDEPMTAYANIITTFHSDKKDKKGNPVKVYGGRAVQSLDKAEEYLSYALDRSEDIYFCLSTQVKAELKTGKNNFTYYKPIRRQENVAALKSLFIDVDFKNYANHRAAIAELNRFTKETGLPLPTYVVHSGGGFHLYWVFNRALTREEWQPLADALAEAAKQLKFVCDTACTIDSARILRLPNTVNKKYDPPRDVKIVGPRVEADYAVERIARILEPYKVKSRNVVASTPALFMDPALFPTRPPITTINNLALGVERNTNAPIDLDSLLPECPFLAQAVATGGKDFANPLWNLTTLCATFTVGGVADAHRMASSHPEYEASSTDELFVRKDREKREKGLGWPACRTIHQSGSTVCATCPHLLEGKTPFHFALKPEPPLKALIPQEIIEDDMPPGYTRREDGVILSERKYEDGTSALEPVIEYPMEDAWLEELPDNKEILHFTTQVSKAKKPKHITVPLKVINGQEMRGTFQELGMLLPQSGRDFNRFGAFMKAWIERLQDIKASVGTDAYGWHQGPDGVDGFIYAGRCWMASGSIPAGTPDPALEAIYQPVGDIEAWKEACKLITNQHRPELNAIIAASFGGPIIRFSDKGAALLSVTSSESGVGKTTTIEVANGVWGVPKLAKQGLTDTVNQVMGKLSRTRHLPAFYDEIHDQYEFEKMAAIVWQFIEGKEKGRMKSSTQLHRIGGWDTILVAASNGSVLNAVVEHSTSTVAGFYRVFEYEVKKTPRHAPGMVSDGEATRIASKLKDNYGLAGLEYAKFLGANIDKVKHDYTLYVDKVSNALNADQDERYWRNLIAALLQGANYANNLGLTEIDEQGLENFLYAKFREMQGRKAREAVDLDNPTNVSDMLARYISEHQATGLIKTNRICVTKGRPVPGAIVIKYPTNISQIKDLCMQVGLEDGLMRIAAAHFGDWLKKTKRQRGPFIRALKEKFHMKEVVGRLGGGTGIQLPTMYLLEIDLNGSPLLDILNDH
jgi:hypothetical protein